MMEPTEAPLNDPTKRTQPTAMLRAATSKNRSDSPFSQFLAMGVRIVRPIALDRVGPLAWSADFACDRRDGIGQRQQLCHVVAIRRREDRGKWDAIRIGNEVVFRARFATIRRVGARFGPPKTARTDAESTTARDQSIWSASRRRSSSTCITLSHTPAFCQSRRRRQQVMPLPHPISCGRYSQGMPVLRTNRMPVNACRWPIGFRPGWRKRRGFGGGNSGSIISHNASSKTGLAIFVPPCTNRTLPNNRIPT